VALEVTVGSFLECGLIRDFPAYEDDGGDTVREATEGFNSAYRYKV
jgi:hypothetical protein